MWLEFEQLTMPWQIEIKVNGSIRIVLKKRLRQDEQCVQDLIACKQEFDAFPFNPISPTLRTLQSAMPASSQLVSDFNSAYAAGEMKLMSFLKERVYSKTTLSIHVSH